MVITAAKEHPIPFTTEMVKAILDRRKTMTRRIIKPQPINNIESDGNIYEGNYKGYVKVDNHPNWQEQFAFEFCPYGKVGDILWVKETYCPVHDTWVYRAEGREYWMEPNPIDWSEEQGEKIKWKSGRFMPKAAARIWLEITDIKVERLQDISNADAMKEGIKEEVIPACGDHPALIGCTTTADNKYHVYAKDAFRSLWQSINGEESWNENPFVWVISFKVLSTNGKPE